MRIDEVKERIFPTEEEIPVTIRPGQPIHQREYLVDGVLRNWDGETREVRSPVCVWKGGELTRQLLGSYPLLDGAAASAALAAAVRAYDNGLGAWPTMSVTERITAVRDFAQRMKRRRDEVVRLLMWEIGKAQRDAEKEFDRTVDYITETVDALKELDRNSSRFVIAQGIIGQIRRAPLGVVLCMGPFNYPLNETFTTLIPALIMGNTVVLKPPRHGVLLFRPLLEAFRESFPAGVVNVIYGAGRTVVPPLMASGQVDVLAFIGSSRAANDLQRLHPYPHRLRSVFGLDAKNPAIVLPDADLDLAVEECLTGGLSFNGQRCTAIKIIFVHHAVADDFLARFSRTLGGLSCGMPWEPRVVVTPVAEETKPRFLGELLNDALAGGARIVNEGGGTTLASFVAPALLYPVTESMRIYREEQFGPLVPVLPFSDLAVPIDYLVKSEFGQQVSIFGRSPEQLARLIDPLVNQVCRVNLNSQCQRGPDIFPFTGRKNSAVGTLSVSDALRSFSIRTLVAAKENDLNREIITTIVQGRKSNFLSTDYIL